MLPKELHKFVCHDTHPQQFLATQTKLDNDVKNAIQQLIKYVSKQNHTPPPIFTSMSYGNAMLGEYNSRLHTIKLHVMPTYHRLHALAITAHELEHARQYKQKDRTRDEKIVVKLDEHANISSTSNFELYANLHTEILARTQSMQLCLEMGQLIKDSDATPDTKRFAANTLQYLALQYHDMVSTQAIDAVHHLYQTTVEATPAWLCRVKFGVSQRELLEFCQTQLPSLQYKAIQKHHQLCDDIKMVAQELLAPTCVDKLLPQPQLQSLVTLWNNKARLVEYVPTGSTYCSVAETLDELQQKLTALNNAFDITVFHTNNPELYIVGYESLSTPISDINQSRDEHEIDTLIHGTEK